jgi:MFS family permease
MMPVYATSNNVSTAISDYAVAILQAGSFFGRALSGILADRFGVWNMYTSSGFISAISLFAFWTDASLPAPVIVIGLFTYGSGSGAWISLVAASCGAISPVREFGMRLGMLWTLSSFGILAGPVVCGGQSIHFI